MEPEALLQSLSLQLPPDEFETWKRELESKIAFLIHHDFERLIRLLYTVDVNERDLKHLLQQDPQRDTAAVITDLIVARQLEKVKTREQFRPDTKPPEEEAW